MRLIVGRQEGQKQAVYAVRDDTAVNLSAQDRSIGNDLTGLVAQGPEVLERLANAATAESGCHVSEITPALPISTPPKILCLGLNYVDHAKEGGYEVPTYPAIFVRFPTSLIAAGQPIVKPACSDKLDYEVELMVIIGKGGRHIHEADALAHVFGYTVFNDGSVRDYQRKTHQWTPGKNFDATGPVGPIVVTADELPPGASGLKIESRLNGRVMQSAVTSDMVWPVAKTIATISEFLTLEPGDMIAMGTPPGVGHARTPPVFMRDGDVIEVEIENIGICRNPIVDEATSTLTAAAE